MMRLPLALLYCLILAFCGAAAAGATDPDPGGEKETLIPVKTPKGMLIYAELADTPVKRGRGLMFRDHLAADRGM